MALHHDSQSDKTCSWASRGMRTKSGLVSPSLPAASNSVSYARKPHYQAALRPQGPDQQQAGLSPRVAGRKGREGERQDCLSSAWWGQRTEDRQGPTCQGGCFSHRRPLQSTGGDQPQLVSHTPLPLPPWDFLQGKAPIMLKDTLK